MYLGPLTKEELILFGLDPRFAQVLSDPAEYHSELPFHVGKPHWDYYIPEGVAEVVPLWDVNADSFVRWVRDGTTEYVWLFHDDPNWVLIATSEQGIMAQLWQDWSQFQTSDDECRRFAEAIGFRHCEQALVLLGSDNGEFRKWQLELDDGAG